MIVAAGYYLRLIIHRQAVLAAGITYLALVSITYANPAGPPLQAGAVTSAGLMPVAGWLTWLAATAESEPFGDITLVATGGLLRRQGARIIATLTLAAGLGVIAVFWGAIANPAPYPATTVVTLIGMHLAEACAGAGTGLMLAPPAAHRAGPAIVVIAGLTIASLAVPWLPPINPLLRIVVEHHSPGSWLLALATGQAGAVGLAGAAAGLMLAQAPGRPG